MKNDQHYKIDDISAGASNILNEIFTVRSYELDAGGRLSLPSLCNFMQDAAGKHAHQLGVSVNDLLIMDHTWVLSRLALQINAYPGWQDNLTVSTWPSGSHRLFALRKFNFSLGSRQSIGTAITAWLVIHTRKRLPVKIESFVKGFQQANPIAEDIDIIEEIGKLALPATFDHETTFAVRHHDLDINGHVNNVKTIEWVLESIPSDKLHHNRLAALKINFMAEALTDDRVISRCRQTNDDDPTYIHSVIKEENGRELVRAQTTWQSTHSKPFNKDKERINGMGIRQST
ncbi:acyl-[acyl-carrier-protein] thioesterase [Thermodesulfobacteriota bacterium]